MTGTLTDRLLVPLALSGAVATLLCLAAASPSLAGDAAMTPAPQGAMTPAATKSEFDDYCAMGLAEGQTAKTDCSVNWIDDDGKVYCFSSEASKQAFLKDPKGNIEKAREFFASKQEAASGPTKTFTEDDVDKRVNEVVAERSKDGVFVFHDPKLDADLDLIMDNIKTVRGMEGYGWFANVIFHDKDEPKKQYAIDFWFKPNGDKLTLMDIRVQKGPKQEGNEWIMITRLPVAWWWLPVQEQNGNPVPLQFVEIHQPVRHLKKEGEYFVCTDFRKPGSKDEYYDIDFWVNQKTGKLEVDNVKMHKIPVQEDGIWTQKPLYTFEGMDFDITN
jgi:YHS domain-containing protein